MSGRSTVQLPVGLKRLWAPEEAEANLKRWRQTLRLGDPQHYRPGTDIFWSGAPAKDMFLLARGVAGLYYNLPSHGEVLYMLGYPGHLLNITNPDLTAHGSVSGTALTNCEAYRLSTERLRAAEHTDPSVAELVERSLKLQIRRRTAALAELLALPPTERMQYHLWELAQVMGHYGSEHDWARVTLPFGDEHLAMLLGISLRQFRRIKKDLQQQGRMRIEGGRTVSVRKR